ncbi:hypothetical protein DVH05_010872 [Phytophthora capsici]|nr:hypothetical protein DVH05_010872 [Phytophthora capsici]
MAKSLDAAVYAAESALCCDTDAEDRQSLQSAALSRSLDSDKLLTTSRARSDHADPSDLDCERRLLIMTTYMYCMHSCTAQILCAMRSPGTITDSNDRGASVFTALQHR